MKRFAVFPLCAVLSGCGTLIGYMAECFGPTCKDQDPQIEYFQATKTDYSLWNLPEEKGQIKAIRWASYPILLVDFPISVVVDTVLLPFQAALNAFAPGTQRPKTDEQPVEAQQGAPGDGPRPASSARP